jgi:futalosine hydrolase
MHNRSKPLIIVSATRLEVEPLLQMASVKNQLSDNLFLLQSDGIDFFLIITGVGIPATIYQLARLFTTRKFKYAINMGIAGSFNDHIFPGTLVQIVEEEFGDIGVEDGNDFKTMFDSKLALHDAFPYKSGKLINPGRIESSYLDRFDKVRGLTVNVTSGSDKTTRYRKSRFEADVETMEGAAFFYACLMGNIPFVALRAISNTVGERNRSKWQVAKAISNICGEMINFLKNDNIKLR